MMTLHTAKGLEYPVVFLTGLEQGTFPHSRSLEDTAELSEERRLAYVGITRAKRRLYITRAAVRAQWGQANEMLPSQFLEEIPDELIDWKRRETGSERMRTGWGDGDEFGGWDDEDDFSSGPTFGHGIVWFVWLIPWVCVWFRFHGALGFRGTSLQWLAFGLHVRFRTFLRNIWFVVPLRVAFFRYARR